MEKQKLHYEVLINAPVAKVWDTMLEKATYEQWTTVFAEGSTYAGSWETGSEMRFIDPSGAGMIAEIVENRPHEFVSIKHIAMLNEKGEPDFEQAKEWAPAFENYTFVEQDGGTLVKVDLEGMEQYADMFNDMWPKALQKLKELAEV